MGKKARKSSRTRGRDDKGKSRDGKRKGKKSKENKKRRRPSRSSSSSDSSSKRAPDAIDYDPGEQKKASTSKKGSGWDIAMHTKSDGSVLLLTTKDGAQGSNDQHRLIDATELRRLQILGVNDLSPADISGLIFTEAVNMEVQYLRTLHYRQGKPPDEVAHITSERIWDLIGLEGVLCTPLEVVQDRQNTFVVFKSPLAAQEALVLDGRIMGGRVLRLRRPSGVVCEDRPQRSIFGYYTSFPQGERCRITGLSGAVVGDVQFQSSFVYLLHTLCHFRGLSFDIAAGWIEVECCHDVDYKALEDVLEGLEFENAKLTLSRVKPGKMELVATNTKVARAANQTLGSLPEELQGLEKYMDKEHKLMLRLLDLRYPLPKALAEWKDFNVSAVNEAFNFNICTKPSPSKTLVLCNIVDEDDVEDDDEYQEILFDIEREVERWGRVNYIVMPRFLKEPPAIPAHCKSAPTQESVLLLEGKQQKLLMDKNDPRAAQQIQVHHQQLEDEKRYLQQHEEYLDYLADPQASSLRHVFVEYQTIAEAHNADLNICGKRFGGRSVITSFLPEEYSKLIHEYQTNVHYSRDRTHEQPTLFIEGAPRNGSVVAQAATSPAIASPTIPMASPALDVATIVVEPTAPIQGTAVSRLDDIEEVTSASPVVVPLLGGATPIAGQFVATKVETIDTSIAIEPKADIMISNADTDVSNTPKSDTVLQAGRDEHSSCDDTVLILSSSDDQAVCTSNSTNSVLPQVSTPGSTNSSHAPEVEVATEPPAASDGEPHTHSPRGVDGAEGPIQDS